MPADPASTPRETVHGPETRRIDVTRGPAHGIALGLSWVMVFWMALAVIVLA